MATVSFIAKNVDVTLIRELSTDNETIGKIVLSGHTFYTIELPWKDNEQNRSCIPAGKYRCSVTYSPHFARALYEIHDVPGRSDIRIHVANVASELKGCITLGLKKGKLNNKYAILDSAKAIELFMQLLNNVPFNLIVVDAKNSIIEKAIHTVKNVFTPKPAINTLEHAPLIEPKGALPMAKNAEIWQTLTGPDALPTWNLFAAIATALGHDEAAKKLQTIALIANTVGSILPPHPEHTPS